MKYFLGVLCCALVAAAGLAFSTGEVVSADGMECNNWQPNFIVGFDTPGPMGPEIYCVLADGTETSFQKECPQYIWETPDHHAKCNDESQGSATDCVCCRDYEYEKEKWSVKCRVDGTSGQNPRCVKDTKTGEKQEFTAGIRLDCPKDEQGACPMCPAVP
jgi:hypothetical protein